MSYKDAIPVTVVIQDLIALWYFPVGNKEKAGLVIHHDGLKVKKWKLVTFYASFSELDSSRNVLKKRRGPDLYFIFYKSISCNNLAKTWERSLEFGMWYLYYMKNALVSTFFDFSFQKPVNWQSEILVFFLILEVLIMQSSSTKVENLRLFCFFKFYNGYYHFILLW